MLVPFARRLIELLKPQAILCFGHLPGQFLAGGEDAIMRSRGKWLAVDGVPLLTTFHPDTLLKSAASKRLAWHDLQAFKQKLDRLS
jgi:uracil-DNA glycosylase